jgi:putative oxidoreductase
VIPARHAPLVYALLRIVAAFLYLTHGLQKVFGVFGGPAIPLGSLLGVAGLIETVAGPFILIGLFARPFAFLASGEMAAAYFLAHQPRGVLPLQNMGEPAVLLCFVFLYVAARGAGGVSVDALRTASRNASTA